MTSLSSIQGITEKDKKLYTEMLKISDPTIKDINISFEKNEVNKKFKINNDFESREFIVSNLKVNVESTHNVYDGDKITEEISLPFMQFESNGTVKMFGILPSILNALKTGGTLFVDEIESGLHPILTRMLIGLFNNAEFNPKHAQLICSSHETYLY